MDNIEFLLESLNSETEEPNGTNLEKDTYFDTDPVSSSEVEIKNVATDSFSSNNKQEILQNISESVFKNDYDFEITRKQLSSRYSGSAYEIHKKLKENGKSRYDYDDSKLHSWSSKKSDEGSRELVIPSSGVKQDVYAEPVFGLRLLNPVVSSSFIQSKMAGKHPVSVSNISYHLRCGDKSKDWVFAGAVVFKSGLKTSQKGSQYCLWKISDLKQELKQVTLYLFGKACSELWKVSLGTVAAVLNASPFYKDEKVSNDEVTLTVKSVDQVMIWGGSRDYGLCKALKKNGEKCTLFVNKSLCEFCIFHVKKEYNKYAGTRMNLQAPSMGLVNLRNKVLGKSEVFYAGKSYTAVDVPKPNKKSKRTFSQMASLSASSMKLRELDERKLERLNLPINKPVNVANIEDIKTRNVSFEISENFETYEVNKFKTLPVVAEEGSKTETSSTSSSTTSSNKPVLSRLHLFKQAGDKMVESGKVTRISAAKAKKTPYFSFADVLTGDPSSPRSPQIGNAKENDSTEKKITLNKKESMIDLSVDVKKSLKSNNLSVISNDANKIIRNKKVPSPVSSRNKSKSAVDYFGPSKILQDFKNLTKKTEVDDHESKQECLNNSSKALETGSAHNVLQNFTNPNQIHDEKTVVRSLMRHLKSPSNSIHDMIKARAKQNAISLIKKQGGILKSNPNQVRSDPNKRKSLKRPADTSDIEDEECPEKSVLSQRFVDLMNATSNHENLVQLAEDIERQDYFNKMEKKEQLEEKMLATYKVPCKAVICLKCKYKWFSASDLCRIEGHPIKVIDTVKRFFKCDNCANRTVSLELVPLISCKQCGSSKWSRTGMIKEKLAKNTNTLSIRGDEIKFLDSLSHSVNMNLLVPDDQ